MFSQKRKHSSKTCLYVCVCVCVCVYIYVYVYIYISRCIYCRICPNNCKTQCINFMLACLLAYLLTHSRTQSLTPCSRALVDKLSGFQLVKKFPPIYGTRGFITAVTRAHTNLSLSSATSILSIPPTSHVLNIHLNIIIPSTSGSYKWPLSLRLYHKIPHKPLLSLIRTTCPAHLILDLITRTILGDVYRSLTL